MAVRLSHSDRHVLRLLNLGTAHSHGFLQFFVALQGLSPHSHTIQYLACSAAGRGTPVALAAAAARGKRAGMADPLAQAFADLPESSESEDEKSDAQSSEEEEELDSEEEAVKKLVRAHLPRRPASAAARPASHRWHPQEAKRKRKAAKREKKAAAKAPDLDVPPADFDGPGDLGSSFALGEADEEPVEAADCAFLTHRRRTSCFSVLAFCLQCSLPALALRGRSFRRCR